MTESKTTLSNKEMKQEINFGPWTVSTCKSHILPSLCVTPSVCRSDGSTLEDSLCVFCRFQEELKLPQLPDMTFASNYLRIKHNDSFGIEFNCLDALKLVDSSNDLMKVAIAELWQQARVGCEHIKEVVKPFDWTFMTEYRGTLIQGKSTFKISDTEEKIDLEKLKVRETIMFYDDIHLFEDELADHGCAQCSVKIRIMQSSFFVLLRYFLRVDNVIVKINDTRLYHEAQNNYILREFTMRENKICNLNVPTTLLTNPNELWQHLPVVKSSHEKLEFES